jgi:hypothetical protein
MRKLLVIFALVIASMASAFGQDSTIMVYNLTGKLVCKATANRPMTDQEKIDWFEAKHAYDFVSGIYFLDSADGKRFMHTNQGDESIRLVFEALNKGVVKAAPTLKTLEYDNSYFMLGDYEFIEMEGLVGSDSDCLVGYVESDYKKVYACSCDYNESVRVMNALNNKKGSNSNITYTVNRKNWGNGDYDVRVIVTFKDAKAEYMAERNKRMNSLN